MTGLNVLGTTVAVTSWTEDRGRPWRRRQERREHRFLDFTIDGVALRDIAEAQWAVSVRLTEMTRLCDDRPWPGEAVTGLRQLLADTDPPSADGSDVRGIDGRDTDIDVPDTDLPDGRVALLVCAVCGDLACRSLGVDVLRSEDVVEWRRLGWQVADEPFVDADAFTPPTTYRFAADAYDRLLRPLLAHYSQLAVGQSGSQPIGPSADVSGQ